MRLAALARFLQRLGAPRAQPTAFEVTPEIRVLNVMLQVAIHGARRAIEPRRNKDANRRHPAGMNIEEAKYLRLGKAEGVEDRAGLQINVGPKLDDELHAERPLADFVAGGGSQPRVEGGTDRADRPTSYDGERRAYIHSGSEARLRVSLAVHPLID